MTHALSDESCLDLVELMRVQQKLGVRVYTVRTDFAADIDDPEMESPSTITVVMDARREAA